MGNLTKNFNREEFEEEGYDIPIHPKIPEVCQKIRDEWGHSMTITSGTRSPEHNDLIGGSSNSSHIRGLACDFSCESSRDRYLAIKVLIEEGITRFGVADNFIHFDVDPEKAQKVTWLY
jgi:uncharacterized protein YcbK (DUF882 family)